LIDFPHASLAYLTEPTPGQAVINVQVESGELVRAITRNPDGSPASPIGQILDDMVMG